MLASGQKANSTTVRRLLAAGATIGATNEDGFSAAHYAGFNDQLEILAVLVDAGADPHQRTALHDGRCVTPLDLVPRWRFTVWRGRIEAALAARARLRARRAGAARPARAAADRRAPLRRCRARLVSQAARGVGGVQGDQSAACICRANRSDNRMMFLGRDSMPYASESSLPTFECKQDFTALKALGSGAHSVVFSAVCTSNGQRVALKKLSYNPRLSEADAHAAANCDELPRWSQLEAELLRRFSHAHVLRSFGSFTQLVTPELEELYIVAELGKVDLLAECVSRPGGHLLMDEVMLVTRQIASAVAHVHAHGVLHRDIKPNNIILFERDEQGRVKHVKLCDFSLANVGEDDANDWVSAGTLCWRAPETTHPVQRITPACDVWSLGASCAALLTGSPPFCPHRLSLTVCHVCECSWVDKDDGDMTHAHTCRALSARLALPAGTPPKFAALINKCCSRRAKSRPTASAIVEHDALRPGAPSSVLGTRKPAAAAATAAVLGASAAGGASAAATAAPPSSALAAQSAPKRRRMRAAAVAALENMSPNKK